MTLPSLTLVRRFKAPPERVFRAWTDPELMRQWLGPHHTHVEDAACDARQGGEFRFTIVEDAQVRDGPGHRHGVAGKFEEFDEPVRLVFTWQWVSRPERTSLVTVTLRAVAEGTELTLLHERFADEATATRHIRGWTESLERLAVLAA